MAPGGGGAVTGGGPNSGLSQAAALAARQPGLSRAQFDAEIRKLAPEGGFEEFNIGAAFSVYKQLTGGSGATSADEVTAPEPEGPGRFQATRPGDLLGAASLRFNA